MVRLETRPPNLEGEGQITMRDLVRNCLRMRPERIIVGEVRGPEAFDLLQAMNTGHDGSMGTLHANMPREALSRIESMITMGGYSLPSRTIREMICGSIDVIIQAARLRDGSRRITHITEVMGMEGDVIITQDLFVYEILGEDANGNIIGQHRSTGIGRPKFWERARYYGEEARLAAALDAAGSRRAGRAADGGEAAMQVLGLFFLVAVAIGGVAWVFVYPILSGERKAERRHGERRARRADRAADPGAAQKPRREQIEGSSSRWKSGSGRPSGRRFRCACRRPGLIWSKRRFMVTAVVLRRRRFRRLAADRERACCRRSAFAFAAGAGLPLWMLKFLKKRREARFLERFARRRRRDRARHQGRPAAARQPQADRRRSAGARAQRIPRHHRDADRSASRSARPASSSTSAFRCRRRIFSAS